MHVDEFTHSTHTHVPLADHMHLDRNAVVIGDQQMVQLCVRGCDSGEEVRVLVISVTMIERSIISEDGHTLVSKSIFSSSTQA